MTFVDQIPGVSGGTIIKKLMQGSSSFQDRTEFSKQKYIKKKMSKYFTFVKLVKPSALTLCKSFYESKPDKIGYLRFDSLAQLLNYANVQANSQVLVFENCSGLVLGAVAERVAGRYIGDTSELTERVFADNQFICGRSSNEHIGKIQLEFSSQTVNFAF